MVRAKRLLALIDILTQQQTKTAQQLAIDLSVSERTIYRDLNTLREEGAQIEALPDGGLALSAGWRLPPIMFFSDEMDALLLGARWVATHTDPSLAMRAQRAMAKLNAVLSVPQQEKIKNSALIIAPKQQNTLSVDLAQLRNSIDLETKIQIDYQDLADNASRRVIWPFAIAYYENLALLVAWCELRQDFRNFRTDKIVQIEYLSQKYPNTRLGLHQLWLQKQMQNHVD